MVNNHSKSPSMKRKLSITIAAVFAVGYMVAQVTTPPANTTPTGGAGDTVKATTLPPDQAAEISYNKGIEDFGKGDFNAALLDFNQAITLKPDFEAAFLNRGNTRLKLKDYKGALDDYGQAVKLNANDDKAYYGVAQVEAIIGTQQQVLDAYNHAIQANPKNADALYYRGEIKFQLKDFQGAIDDFTQAINAKPG